jgi:Uma2 family endonuclease
MSIIAPFKPAIAVLDLPNHLPDHLELPVKNGEFSQSFREAAQSILLASSIWPVLESIHPDRQFAVGQDSGIYWRLSNPPERGAVAPDWFYVPGVPPDLNGHYRRSYVFWKELISPAVIIEYASGDGSEERDRTPLEGKFWIYENAVRGVYYAIFVVETGELEVHRLEGTNYRRLEANERGHYAIDPLGVELGVWNAFFWNETAPWLRWFNTQGKLLPIGDERAIDERLRADQERRKADQERRKAKEARRQADESHRRADEAVRLAENEQRRAELFAAKLRELGLDPSTIGSGPNTGAE